MTEISVHDFHREVNCIYDEERYSVRDNGAVLRHSRTNKRPRLADNQWTFGKPNIQNGYMHVGKVRVHRIVATAFHGEPPTLEHVVDHIDTNRQNNRPENLRWLTRLENALQNPITRKRIELVCGSIEAFLEEPSKLQGTFDSNFEWMRRVSPEEAQACRERMHLWAKSDKTPSGGSLGEWLFKPSSQQPYLEKSSAKSDTQPSGGAWAEWASKPFTQEPPPEASWKVTDLVLAITPGAAQRKWRTPTEFPCCPQKAEEGPIAAYAANLTAGVVFSSNHLSTSMVLGAAVATDGQSVCVMCERAEKGAVKPWSVATVTFEDGLYVHTSLGTYFDKEGAEKYFCIARGLEWTGGDTFDDFC